MELFFILVVIAVLAQFAIQNIDRIADGIGRVMNRRYRDGGTVTAHGMILRDGARLPFSFTGSVNFSDAMVNRIVTHFSGSSPWGRIRGSVVHTTAIRNALADLLVDAIDAGAGAGTIQFQTAADAEVATLTFSDPAFGNAVNGTATANAITSDSNATGGTVAKARIFDSNAAEVFNVTDASVGGADINLTNNPGAGDELTMSSFTYSAAT